MEPHQRVRINVLLGLDEDIRKIYLELSALKDDQKAHQTEVQKALDDLLLRLNELDKSVTERLQNLENRIKYSTYSDEKLESLKKDFEKQIDSLRSVPLPHSVTPLDKIFTLSGFELTVRTFRFNANGRGSGSKEGSEGKTENKSMSAYFLNASTTDRRSQKQEEDVSDNSAGILILPR